MIKLTNINIQFINCDTCIKESIVPNPDDSYTIFLNARLSREQQIRSYKHALKHIKENVKWLEDFYQREYERICKEKCGYCLCFKGL